MKRNKRKNKMAAFLTALLLTALCLCQAVFAADTAGIDPTRQASLQIDLKEIGVTTTDKTATIAVYLVGEWDGSKGAYDLTAEFAGSKAKVTKLETAEDVLTASRILDAYAQAQSLADKGRQTTENGEASFKGLTTGLYLVCQRKGVDDNVTVSPFLTTLPVLNEETQSWNYDVRCYPKSQIDEQPTDPTDPVEPTDPSNPTDPAEPTDPVNPTDPTNPTSPTTPDTEGGGNDGNNSNGSGNGDRGGGSGGRTITDLTNTIITALIGDDPAPQAGLTGGEGDGEDAIFIEEEGVPLFALPKTGDDSATYGMLISVMVLAAVGGVLMFRKRKEAAES